MHKKIKIQMRSKTGSKILITVEFSTIITRIILTFNHILLLNVCAYGKYWSLSSVPNLRSMHEWLHM